MDDNFGSMVDCVQINSFNLTNWYLRHTLGMPSKWSIFRWAKENYPCQKLVNQPNTTKCFCFQSDRIRSIAWAPWVAQQNNCFKHILLDTVRTKRNSAELINHKGDILRHKDSQLPLYGNRTNITLTPKDTYRYRK